MADSLPALGALYLQINLAATRREPAGQCPIDAIVVRLWLRERAAGHGRCGAIERFGELLLSRGEAEAQSNTTFSLDMTYNRPFLLCLTTATGPSKGRSGCNGGM